MPDNLSLASPPGCRVVAEEWPWPEPWPAANFAALRYDTDTLCRADLADWHTALPRRLTTAADKRRAEFLAGRLSARRAIQALTGVPATPGIDEERLPLWPETLVGSITHSHGLAAATVARRSHALGIGLDAERQLTPERAQRLAPQILVDAEREWMESLADSERGKFVTLVFSLKESLFKALYPLVRRRFHFPDACLTDWTPASGHVAISLTTTLAPEWPAGARLDGQVTEIDDYLLTFIAIPPRS
ncbi:4'-phosphopantetheinyl transferase family protein [Salinicola rhizosphaerae]|uniref:Enterobactin synthase component D n=1 Tax=Salinicola rhizosphaerae TaxID=1443141 RepID=A0ABQ3E709_9GAMM|nr:4'-phosphopantetheinyl transferase superfamily protein [Salinicola rhizosphaerae]GHB24557.1 4'-phosphopantetheinyl transferase [Salinicola rhizosphaerae]